MRTDNTVSKCGSGESENEDHGYKTANTAILLECGSFLLDQLWDRCAFHWSVKMLVCVASGVLKNPNLWTAFLNF